jgi:hypothetical protein
MVASAERPLKMLVVHARHGGFYIALVPGVLSEEQVEAAFEELRVEAAAVLELSDWKTSSDNVAVAFVPGLGVN